MMSSVADDRERLRETFNSAAQIYQRARPDYPEELYDELIRLTALPREIRERLARRPGPTLRRHWGCVLHAARRA
jgi:hypothetical protein